MVSIRGGGGAFTKKIFTPVGCLRDHVTIMLHIPRILLAYVGVGAHRTHTHTHTHTHTQRERERERMGGYTHTVLATRST